MLTATEPARAHDPAHATWEVTAVRYATYASTTAKLVLQQATYGEPDAPQRIDYFFYVLRSPAGEVVVVDCGFEPARGRAGGRDVLVEPLEALRGLGVEPGEVARLVLTHLHYDHIGNLGAFAAAEVLVPATELAFWRTPLARHPPYWAHTDPAGLAALDAADAQGRVRTYEGWAELAPGLSALEVGGHSPGQAMLLVRTAAGPLLLCSDAVHLEEELRERRPFHVVDDLQAQFRAFDLVELLRRDLGCRVVPGHDPLVADAFEALDAERRLLRLA